MPRLLPFAVLLFGGHGLRTLNQQDWVEPGSVVRPTGPAVKPVGRHIQALFMTRPHGLTDRIWKFIKPLIALGHHFNATVHMPYGAHGPRQWLSGFHSAEIAESWGRYFDISANGGNPFHETENFLGCRELETHSAEDLQGLFQGGELCVNLLYMADRAPWDVRAHNTPPLLVSKEIAAAAERFRARYELPEDYGSCHIRRCDRFGDNRQCTDPAVVAQAVSDAGGGRLRSWLFFLYAEAGYREALQAALAPLQLRSLFEDEALLNDAHPGDNYFTYLLGKYLQGGAETVLETHVCKSPRPKVLQRREVSNHGLLLSRWQGAEASGQELFAEEEEAARAVCDDRATGAKLVPPGGYHGGFESDVVRSHAR